MLPIWEFLPRRWALRLSSRDGSSRDLMRAQSLSRGLNRQTPISRDQGKTTRITKRQRRAERPRAHTHTDRRFRAGAAFLQRRRPPDENFNYYDLNA
ncbi:hypothetical protein EVAR_83234_1 [Eumeta japonica]|uniref:Uncharacterized protein n=1 Tax=Eumeta variegata TaxID=151549 RepID=A0A4C1Y1X7_EUMVA|nr:hypothetical protein EVAR_83234_1 [Eumeta japonica]